MCDGVSDMASGEDKKTTKSAATQTEATTR